MSVQPAHAAMDDLEALFDQVAATYQPAPVAQGATHAATVEPANEPAMGGSDDIEALFDQVASARAARGDVSATITTDLRSPAGGEPRDIYQRIGQLTRGLHDALCELGYAKDVEHAVSALPDARARLAYIVNLTGNAAERALGASERGMSLQDAMQTDAVELSRAWDDIFAGRQSVDAFKATAGRTHTFLNSLAQRTDETNAQFLEVMMAQDFHDLTGQVINRLAAVTASVEEQLVKLLVISAPTERRGEAEPAWLSGPVVDAPGRAGIVTSQGQVDELLESLGF